MKTERKHITIDQRKTIEEGIYEELTASAIARRINVSPSTVTREVKTNRHIRLVNRKINKPSLKCKHRDTCKKKSGPCRKCVSHNSLCIDCAMRDCTDGCTDFAPRLCDYVEKWPYVCPTNCKNRKSCWFPKCRYIACRAQDSYETRLVQTREGIDISEEELSQINMIVTPLIKKGQSPNAIWSNHENELSISSRTYYNYVHDGIVDIQTMELRRAVKFKQRNHAKNSHARNRIDRSGREYDDYIKLSLTVIQRTVQVDSIIGRKSDEQRIISLHITRINFQFYFLVSNGKCESFIEILNSIERILGSAEKFRQYFGLLLGDRGEEFDNADGIETSCLNPDKRRCKIYFCDANKSFQKGKCEKNHVEFRKILPKKQCNFDALTKADAALITAHVNSYPRLSLGGISPIKLAKKLLPEGLLDAFGIEEIQPDNVTLKQSLLPHTKL